MPVLGGFFTDNKIHQDAQARGLNSSNSSNLMKLVTTPKMAAYKPLYLGYGNMYVKFGLNLIGTPVLPSGERTKIVGRTQNEQPARLGVVHRPWLLHSQPKMRRTAIVLELESSLTILFAVSRAQSNRQRGLSCNSAENRFLRRHIIDVSRIRQKVGGRRLVRNCNRIMLCRNIGLLTCYGRQRREMIGKEAMRR